jgi:hypothetical protein
MLGLAILFAALGLGFAIGYGTRSVVSRRRHVEYLAYEPYLSAPQPNAPEGPGKTGASAPERQRATSVGNAVSILADRLSFALALDLTLVLLVLLLWPTPS